MTDSITITGLHYLPNINLTVVLAGLVCGSNYVPDQFGQIVVPMGSDPDGLLSPGYLTQVSFPGAYGDAEVAIQITDDVGTWTVYVPLIIGIGYGSLGQLNRPFGPDEIKSPRGPGLGKRKRVNYLSALLTNTAGISFGTSLLDVEAAQFPDDAGNVDYTANLFSGVYWDTLPDDYGYDAMLCWSVAPGYSAVINQIGGFIKTEDAE